MQSKTTPNTNHTSSTVQSVIYFPIKLVYGLALFDTEPLVGWFEWDYIGCTEGRIKAEPAISQPTLYAPSNLLSYKIKAAATGLVIKRTLLGIPS